MCFCSQKYATFLFFKTWCDFLLIYFLRKSFVYLAFFVVMSSCTQKFFFFLRFLYESKYQRFKNLCKRIIAFFRQWDYISFTVISNYLNYPFEFIDDLYDEWYIYFNFLLNGRYQIYSSQNSLGTDIFGIMFLSFW